VINTVMAERDFAGRDPIGVRLAPSLRYTDTQVLYTIVGVVNEPRRFGSGLLADPTVFIDMTQVPLQSRSVVVPTSGDPGSCLRPSVRPRWPSCPARRRSGVSRQARTSHPSRARAPGLPVCS
jgi:hypothetical protein